MQPETATEEGQAGSSQPGQQQKSDISSKVSKVSDILRNSLLALLVAIFLNTALSTGQPRSVLVLSWILLFFAIIWAITEAVSPFKQVAAAFSLTVYALAISIGALAFANSLY
ncbi:hypothetical protein VTP01DRAFT_1659 [Rhizomucor pusillus]|uniref:uncharacterized protein n=1 Tax=Rhizomucor pusillus TaxID=4840 RepID=UPI0037428743